MQNLTNDSQVRPQPPVKKQKKERDQTYYDQQFQFSVIAA